MLKLIYSQNQPETIRREVLAVTQSILQECLRFMKLERSRIIFPDLCGFEKKESLDLRFA